MLMFMNQNRVVYHVNDSGHVVPYTSKYVMNNIFGKKDIECTFIDGRLHGELIKYHPETGQIWAKFNFLTGQRHGLQYRFHLNGKVLTESEYACGIRHGIYKIFSEYGDLIESKIYQFGNYYT
jgi:antitoxin component YwqK of YwqJK toxin-antitoxin module